MSPMVLDPVRFSSGAGLGAGHGGTTPAFVAATTQTTASTTVNKPAGAQVGDHLIIVACVNAGVTCTGFKRYTAAMSGGTANWLVRTLDGSEGATFTLSASVRTIAVLYRGGVGVPAPLNFNGTTGTVTSGLSRAIAPVEGVAVRCLCTNKSSGSATITSDAGATQRGNVTGSFWGVSVTEDYLTAGQDVTRTSTFSASEQYEDLVFFIPKDYYIPAFEYSVSGSGNTTTPTITIPASAAVGDLFVCAFSKFSSGAFSSGPSGFTELGKGTVTGGSNPLQYWWGYKILASGDPGSAVNATYTGSQVWGAAGMTFKNPKASSPVDVIGTALTGITHTTPLATASVTAGLGGRLALDLIALIATNTTSGLSVDSTTKPGASPEVNAAVASGFGNAALALTGVADGGTSIDPTVTFSSSGPSWASQAVLLNPW